MKSDSKIMWMAVFAILFSHLVYAADQPAPRLITVTGEAEVRVVPDEIILTLGVETWNSTLNAAKIENDQKTMKIIGAAQSNKIEEKYIQTDYLSIEPRYEDSYEHKRFIGYFVRKSIVLTLKDISLFEKILSDVLDAGANFVHGVDFRTTELRKYKDQARLLAIKAAQEKAIALAGELNQKVGRPNQIQEVHSGWGSWYNNWWGSRWGGGMAQNVVQNAGSSTESDSSIALGQIKVTAQVTVSFELE